MQKQLIAIEPDSTRRYSNYNSLAISYYCANQNDSALLALRKATECLYTSADSLKALYYVMRNYADILSDSGKNQEAINLQRHSLQEYKETKHPFESLSYYALSRYFLNMGQVDSARYYIQMGDSVRSPYIDQDLSLANFYLVQKTLMNYIDSRSFTIRDVAFFSNRLYNNFIRDQRVIAQKEGAIVTPTAEYESATGKTERTDLLCRSGGSLYFVVADCRLVFATEKAFTRGKGRRTGGLAPSAA